MNDILELRPIGGLECYMATPPEIVLEQTEASLQRQLPEIEELPEWKKFKGNEPIAIAGGGPSIKYTIEELKNFRTIIACGSSHDWLVEHGIRPTYTLVLDPDRISADYIKKPVVTCNYLLASCCHPEVFDLLKNFPVTRWHSTGPEVEWYKDKWEKYKLKDVDGRKPIIGGGCTCGLRAISIAMLFGYRNLHFFGIDGNIDMNTYNCHVYPLNDPEKEEEGLGEIIEMRLGGPNGRYFKVRKYMMAQLWGFKELVTQYGHVFDVTIHGDSITYEFMRIKRENMARKAREIKEQELKEKENAPVH